MSVDGSPPRYLANVPHWPVKVLTGTTRTKKVFCLMRRISLLPLCNFLQVNQEICTCYRFVTFCNIFFAITHAPQHGALPWLRASARRCLCLFDFQHLCALINRGSNMSIFLHMTILCWEVDEWWSGRPLSGVCTIGLPARLEARRQYV